MTKGSQSQRVCVQCVAVRSPDIRRATVRVKVNTFSPQATPVRLRVRASGRTPVPRPRRCGSNSHRSSPASSTNGQVEKRGGVPRADQRFAPLHRPARVLIRIRFAFWLRAGSAPSPIRDRPVPGGKLSVDRILPTARDVLRSGAQRFATGTRPPCYCFVHATATVL